MRVGGDERHRLWRAGTFPREPTRPGHLVGDHAPRLLVVRGGVEMDGLVLDESQRTGDRVGMVGKGRAMLRRRHRQPVDRRQTFGDRRQVSRQPRRPALDIVDDHGAHRHAR